MMATTAMIATEVLTASQRDNFNGRNRHNRLNRLNDHNSYCMFTVIFIEGGCIYQGKGYKVGHSG